MAGEPRPAAPFAGALAGLMLAPLLALLLGACQALPEADARVGAEGTPLGVNDIGEECRIIRAETVRSGVPGAEQAWAIQCAGWEQPSARLVRAKASQPIDALATGGAWRERLDAFAACEAPQPAKVLGDLPALALDCSVRRGGWPYSAIVTGVGDTAFLGDSIPASAGVMERAVGVLIGKSTADAPPPAAVGGPRIPGLYSAGDLDRYRQLLRAAQYHNFQGDHAEAERLYREALALQRQRIGGTDASLAFVLMHIALELSNQERFSEADATFEAADESLRLSIDPADEVRLISYRALHFANQQRSQKAMQLAQEATTRRRELAGSLGGGTIGRTADLAAFVTAAGAPVAAAVPLGGGMGQTAQGDIVQSRYLEAAMLMRQSRLGEAEAALQEALAVIAVDPRVPRRWRPQCQSLLAEVAERRGDLRSAETLLLESIDGLQAQAAGSRAEALALLTLGRVRAATFRTEPALQAFRAGFAIIRDSKRGVRLDDAWPFFATALDEADRRPEAKAALAREMFETAQLIRSTHAAQGIALASARLAASDREVGRLIRDLQDARRQRDGLRETLTQARASPEVLAPQIEVLDQRFRKADEQVAELERLVQAASPRYQLLLDQAVPATDVQAALRPGEALLQVLVGPSASMGLLVEADGVFAYRIPLAERDVQRVVSLLRAPFDEVPGAPFDVARAHALYETLLGPVEARLAGVRHLIFVPSGPLQTLPPGVLITEPPAAVPAEEGYGSYAWLALRMALSTAPSVQAYASLRRQTRPSQANRALIGFGDFLAGRDVDGTLRARGLPESCRAALRTLAELPPLPNTAGELQAVRDALPAGSVSLNLREAFSEQAVRRAKLADYRIVYFATHALLPSELDCWNEPLLLTSGPAGGQVTDPHDDGALLASEVMDLELDAELVVLSACNTAGPDGARSGDNLSGLARAFFYAGARALLVTQWRIPDAPTRALMTRMFEAAARKPVSTAEALREAQTAMIRTPALSHPLNWAAFSVVGDGGRPLAGAASS